MKWRWALVFLPLVLALAGAITWSNSNLEDPIVYMRASMSSILLLLGVLAMLILLVVAFWQHTSLKHTQEINQTRIAAAEDRRRFLRRLDHELKNPLMAIRAGLANFANAPTNETRRSALSSVESQTMRLSRLTADLRKIAELGTRSLELTRIDMTDLLEEAVTLAKDKPEADSRRLTLIVPRAPWPLSPISGDWDLIFLAVYNVLENAIKFTRPGDTVEVRAREDASFVVIEIADTGPGIEASEIPHVWEELYRGKGGRQVPGSGLGMALVKAVVERHGGNVGLHSRAGHGTVVSIHLPIERP